MTNSPSLAGFGSIVLYIIGSVVFILTEVEIGPDEVVDEHG